MKLALTCALAYRPALLVLDEPLSGLDPLVRDELLENLLRQAGEMTILISSHEVSEIEGVITHLAFVDEGRVLLQEPIGELTGRLREIHVTLDHQAAPPPHAPAEWLQVRASGNVLSFVDTRFTEENVRGRIGAVLRGVRAIDSRPVALRSVFTTFARAAREAGG